MSNELKNELREQKIRLDAEFSNMLSKISNRKAILTDLEGKLAKIDKTRQTKDEELKSLERKLVVLLEEQEKEIQSIKLKQVLFCFNLILMIAIIFFGWLVGWFSVILQYSLNITALRQFLYLLMN